MKFYFRKISVVLLLVNFIFWLALATVNIFSGNDLLIKILIFLEPIIFAGSAWGIYKKNRVIYYLTIVFLPINAILSITDQMGLLDFLSLILSLIAFVFVLLAKKDGKKD